jgi:hypothetical protein
MYKESKSRIPSSEEEKATNLYHSTEMTSQLRQSQRRNKALTLGSPIHQDSVGSGFGFMGNITF